VEKIKARTGSCAFLAKRTISLNGLAKKSKKQQTLTKGVKR
jgi:hypothetical protein